MAGKRFLGELASRLCIFPVGKNFRINPSILLSFRDKCVFAEIQDAFQEWQENEFWENSPVDSADTLGVKIFAEITLSHTIIKINVFYAEN